MFCPLGPINCQNFGPGWPDHFPLAHHSQRTFNPSTYLSSTMRELVHIQGGQCGTQQHHRHHYHRPPPTAQPLSQAAAATAVDTTSTRSRAARREKAEGGAAVLPLAIDEMFGRDVEQRCTGGSSTLRQRWGGEG